MTRETHASPRAAHLPCEPRPAPRAARAIILSGLLLCGTYEGMSTEVSKTLDQMNTALVYLFALECVLKLVAFGPLRFFCDNFNIFDTVVVLAGLPNLFLDGLSLGFIRIMRLFRIVRSVKVLRKIKSVRMTIRGLQLGLPDTGSYLLLFTLFVYIATLAGMQLFGGLFGDNPPDSNFDSLSRAAISSLQLITCAGWADIYFSGLRFGQGVASNIVLLPLMILGRFFLVQLLTAVLIARLPPVPLIKRSDNARIQLRLMHEKKVRALEHFKSIQRGGAFAMAAAGGEHETEETSERGDDMAEDDDDSLNSSPASKRSSTGTDLSPTSERVAGVGPRLLPLPHYSIAAAETVGSGTGPATSANLPIAAVRLRDNRPRCAARFAMAAAAASAATTAPSAAAASAAALSAVALSAAFSAAAALRTTASTALVTALSATALSAAALSATATVARLAASVALARA